MNPCHCAAIFDWNGTLVADTALMHRSTNATLDVMGKPPVDMRAYRKAYTIPFSLMYNALGCTDDDLNRHQDKIFDAYTGAYLSGENKLRARRGAQSMLGQLKAGGYKTAILSNFLTNKIVGLADRLNLLTHFDAVMANEKTYKETMRRMTKGERLQAFIEENETKRGIVIGDTVEEIDIAREYGFVSIAIEGGSCSPARLKSSRPDFQIRTLSQIPAIARKVFG